MTIHLDFKFLTDKRIQLVITMILCGALILGGTFAWFTATQNVLNEFFGSVPKVNLHDDFNEPNKDVYVENSGEEPVLVRVRLMEYMEWGAKGETDPDKLVHLPWNGERNTKADGDKTDKGTIDKTWWPHSCPDSLYNSIPNPDAVDDPGTVDDFHNYWKWEVGGQKWYLPAVGDELESGKTDSAQVVQRYLSDRSYQILTEKAAKDGDLKNYLGNLNSCINDLKKAMDAFDLPNLLDPTDKPNDREIIKARTALNKAQTVVNEYLSDASYPARLTRNAYVYTMDEWVNGFTATDAEDKRPEIGKKEMGDFWVVDNDGWCYWASPLESGAATGLLVNSVNPTTGLIELKKDGKTYYYAVDVSMQAATAEDWEKFGQPVPTGGGSATTDAMSLLEMLSNRCAMGDAGATTLALNPEETRGEYWYLNDDDVWCFDDGRWTYDGDVWFLDGIRYEFAEDAWRYASDGDWCYDGDWYFDGDHWTYFGNGPLVTDSPLPTEEMPPVPTEEPLPVPSGEPLPGPTGEPAPAPTSGPTETPTPTEEPTPGPTETPAPTEKPTPEPTSRPEPSPEPAPSEESSAPSGGGEA